PAHRGSAAARHHENRRKKSGFAHGMVSSARYRRTSSRKDLSHGHVDASTHVLAVHCVPPTHEGVFVQPISHVCLPHETFPPHEPAPLQQSVLVCAALETVPEHDGLPLHETSHFVVALHVTLPLHA